MAWNVRPVPHLGRLEIDEDLPLQHRLWRFERIGWAALGLIIGAGLFGLFGGGPLSRAEAIAPSGALAVHYERFLHKDTRTTLRLRPGPTQADGWRWISLSRDYVDRVAIERVIPDPDRMVVTGRGLRLGFAPGAADEAGEIAIALTPSQAGILHGELSAGSGPGATFTQLVYP